MRTSSETTTLLNIPIPTPTTLAEPMWWLFAGPLVLGGIGLFGSGIGGFHITNVALLVIVGFLARFVWRLAHQGKHRSPFPPAADERHLGRSLFLISTTLFLATVMVAVAWTESLQARTLLFGTSFVSAEGEHQAPFLEVNSSLPAGLWTVHIPVVNATGTPVLLEHIEESGFDRLPTPEVVSEALGTGGSFQVQRSFNSNVGGFAPTVLRPYSRHLVSLVLRLPAIESVSGFNGIVAVYKRGIVEYREKIYGEGVYFCTFRYVTARDKQSCIDSAGTQLGELSAEYHQSLQQIHGWGIVQYILLVSPIHHFW
ncbi:hypothetical protein [Ferrimicrobium acidiphilum]|uniref:hypothetical protein n=1 Tax=Ferrimicrobium acidiphilum TaxID=121039 RepID=UPI0023F0EEB1|nr:hypothetical protein [Ferrimicrobium acidiphilum]